MTKNNKIQNYQTALNRLRHVENIFDALASIFPSQNPDTLKQFSLARNNVSVVRDLTLEDFLNENFSDCVSDCATVTPVKPVQTVLTQTVTPVSDCATVQTVNPVSRTYYAPVILTKGDESLSFKNLTAAAKFLHKKFGNQDFRSVGTYANQISFYLQNPVFAKLRYFHGYIPSRSQDVSEIPRGICAPVTLTKGNESLSFKTLTEAANFLYEKFGKQDGAHFPSYFGAISKYCNGIRQKPSQILHGYIPARNENN